METEGQAEPDSCASQTARKDIVEAKKQECVGNALRLESSEDPLGAHEGLSDEKPHENPAGSRRAAQPEAAAESEQQGEPDRPAQEPSCPSSRFKGEESGEGAEKEIEDRVFSV